MITYAGLSNHHWTEAVATTAYLRNWVTPSAIKEDMTLYERFHGRKLDISYLKVFGCVAYAYILVSKRQKLDKKTEK